MRGVVGLLVAVVDQIEVRFEGAGWFGSLCTVVRVVVLEKHIMCIVFVVVAHRSGRRCGHGTLAGCIVGS